jgi:alcohol sulfotransferase
MRLPEGTPTAAGFLCSHPKSGRTWMRFALARYLSRVFDLGLEIDLHTMWTVLPNFDSPEPQPGRDLAGYAFADRPEVPLIVSTHLPYDPELFGETPIVFLVRSPYDVVVSYFFQRSKTERSYHGGLRSFVRDADLGAAGLVDYLNTWAPALNGNGAVTLSYESLRADVWPGFIRILQRFGLRIDNGAARDALAYAAIPNMRRIELAHGIVNLDYDQSDPDALRVRRAVVSGFHDYLDDADVRYVREICDERLSAEARELLERHGVAP